MMNEYNDIPQSYYKVLKWLQQEFIDFLRTFNFKENTDFIQKELIKDYYKHVENFLKWLPGSPFWDEEEE